MVNTDTNNKHTSVVAKAISNMDNSKDHIKEEMLILDLKEELAVKEISTNRIKVVINKTNNNRMLHRVVIQVNCLIC